MNANAPTHLQGAFDRGDGTHLVRGGDLGCVQLLLVLRQAVLQLPPGSIVHLQTTDPLAPIDLPTWCRLAGHHYLGRIGEQPPPTYGIKVGNNPRATSSRSPWRTI